MGITTVHRTLYYLICYTILILYYIILYIHFAFSSIWLQFKRCSVAPAPELSAEQKSSFPLSVSDSLATYGAIEMCFDWLIDWFFILVLVVNKHNHKQQPHSTSTDTQPWTNCVIYLLVTVQWQNNDWTGTPSNNILLLSIYRTAR